MRRTLVMLSVLALFAVMLAAPVAATDRPAQRTAVAVGSGGAVSTVDERATAAGLEILSRGGNAVDAAVAAAGVLGVTDPFSAGIGGGGFMVIHLADGSVVTIDGREQAPSDPAFDADVFLEDGVPIPFFPERITSGLAVGVPGTLATWVAALEDYGTISLSAALEPGERIARRGFPVDATFASQADQDRFLAFPATADLFLPGGVAPEIGSKFKNPDLAATYRLIRTEGPEAFYSGPLAEEIVAAVTDPPTVDEPAFEVRPGLMSVADIEAYEVLRPEPTMSEYRGLQIFGMAPPSSGGITVGEALNIADTFDLGAVSDVQRQHHMLEATALAFADRNAYIGDDRPEFNYVPTAGLLDPAYAAVRAALIDPNAALPKSVDPGDPCPFDGSPLCVSAAAAVEATAGVSTTHLVTADQWGNVVSYTLTIESTGGSGIVVPGRGFLLNNELTDFNSTGDGPNLPAPNKRPRSSMSPTIVLADGEPFLAVGSPGGSTIITTVVEVLINRIDAGMTLPEAVAAPRATQRNTSTVGAEAAYLDLYGAGLEALGHEFSDRSEIGAVTAIEFLSNGDLLAAAEPERRGGGSAGVVTPTNAAP